MSTSSTLEAGKFLKAAYAALDFEGGDLVGHDLPRSDPLWLEKGDWASLAEHVNADKVFFVQGNPVVVFAKRDGEDRETHRQAFTDIWCMSRPNLLFLATPGELAVYDLTEPPPRDSAEWERRKPLDTVRDVSQVATALRAYHRAQIESGKLFEEKRFGTKKLRADKSLIQDLKRVRTQLVDSGLGKGNLQYAHALIGRSIFLRYLEDREILTRDYFANVARGNREWRAILDSSPNTPHAVPDMDKVLYLKVLANKDFTYALFRQLAKDFNGDMFPEGEAEEAVVTQKHLTLLQGFLRGDTEAQRKLFFWAYRFDIIPIELVSSIYEEFYTTGTGGKDSRGTHYTPPALVDFLLNQVLTRERLGASPTVLDPACGSGIFLVESFRRIVRYRVQAQNGRRLSGRQLRNILRDQIRGIDVNEEAVRVAAFSLYLALLHYQEPRDILAQIKNGERLPCLVKGQAKGRNKSAAAHFDILLAENAFSPGTDMKVDVVVGNPPWGGPPPRDKEGQALAKVALDWCASRKHSVGDKERSQAFIWRTISLLKEGGSAGLLVSSGVLHKHSSTSKAFRQEWLREVSLEQVVHFAHVRHVFFPSADAPFASVVFTCPQPGAGAETLMYASAKKSEAIDGTQSVILSKNDIRYMRQRDMTTNDASWKILWWGNHHDKALVGFLSSTGALKSLMERPGESLSGFNQSGPGSPQGSIEAQRVLETRDLERYGRLSTRQLLRAPGSVYRIGNCRLYSGTRIAIRRGISQQGETKGRIIARLATESFSFRHSIYGMRLAGNVADHELVLGIIWSSLAQYYLFLTASRWGMWHYEIAAEEWKLFPLCLSMDSEARSRILSTVGRLRALSPEEMLGGDTLLSRLESELDEAVFDSYGLGKAERDLVRDMCDVGIPFFYDPEKSPGACSLVLDGLRKREGTFADLDEDTGDRVDIQGYLRVFLRIWNRELEADGEFAWRVIAPGYPTPMLAVVFSTQDKGTQPRRAEHADEDEWRNLLKQLAEDGRVPFHSDQVYIDGLFRTLSPTQIVIIKRNEGRLWTRSAAREDAEAMFVKALQLEDEGDAAE